MALLSEANF